MYTERIAIHAREDWGLWKAIDDLVWSQAEAKRQIYLLGYKARWDTGSVDAGSFDELRADAEGLDLESVDVFLAGEPEAPGYNLSWSPDQTKLEVQAASREQVAGLKARVEREIARAEAARLPKPSPPEPAPPPPPLWRRFVRHRWVVGIGASIIGGAILWWLIAILS